MIDGLLNWTLSGMSCLILAMGCRQLLTRRSLRRGEPKPVLSGWFSVLLGISLLLGTAPRAADWPRPWGLTFGGIGLLAAIAALVVVLSSGVLRRSPRESTGTAAGCSDLTR